MPTLLEATEAGIQRPGLNCWRVQEDGTCWEEEEITLETGGGQSEFDMDKDGSVFEMKSKGVSLSVSYMPSIGLCSVLSVVKLSFLCLSSTDLTSVSFRKALAAPLAFLVHLLRTS